MASQRFVGADQVAGRLRRPVVDLQLVEARPVGQLHQRRGLQRAVDLVHVLRRRACSQSASHFSMRRSGCGEIGSRTGAAAPPDSTTSSIASSRSPTSSRRTIDVGVAGDAEGGRGHHLAAGEHGRGVGRDHVFQPRQSTCLLGGRAAESSAATGGHRHDHDPLRPARRGGQHRRHVQLQVRQQRRRIKLLDRQRRQDRQDLLGEIGLAGNCRCSAVHCCGSSTASPCSASRAGPRGRRRPARRPCGGRGG